MRAIRSLTLPAAGILLHLAGFTNPACGQTPTCTTATAPIFTQRWGGLLHDVFALPDGRTWIVEDGGRIRYSATGDFLTSGAWSWQSTPLNAWAQLLRIHVMPNGGRGWAVGEGGLVLGTPSASTGPWNCLWSEPDATQPQGKAVLYDVHFTSGNQGWLLGLHQLKYSLSGGVSWQDCTLKDPTGTDIDPYTIELYAFDFLKVGDDFVGVMAAEPGLFFRTDSSPANLNGQIWHQVDDVESLTIGQCTAFGECGDEPLEFEPWDVEFVPGTDLANSVVIVVGGIGNHCGFAFASPSGGAAGSWVQELHVNDAPPFPCGNPPQLHPSEFWNHFETIYGMGTMSDGSATGCGYGGMQVWRDPASLPTGQTVGAAWRDRSNYVAPCPPLAGHPTQPLAGADASGSGCSATAWIVGLFGAVRKSLDGGQTYADHTSSEPSRIQDVVFKDANRGWKVGQRSVIEESLDGGKTWTTRYPDFSLGCAGLPRLNAISWSGSTRLITVGGVDPSSYPRIVVGVIGASSSTWTKISSTTIPNPFPPEAQGHGLYDVDHATAQTWYAGGEEILLRTTNGGATWANVDMTTITTLHGPFDVQGLAFDTADQGFVAGALDPGTSNEHAGIFYTTNATAPVPTWTDVLAFGSATQKPIVLMDVASNGTDRYAVGLYEDTSTGPVVEKGLVLKWNASLSLFELDPNAPVLTYCMFDGTFFDGPIHTRRSKPYPGTCAWGGSILNDVEIVPGTGDVFVGGDCGRVLLHESAGWREVKSATSLHITGMSFPTAGVGFLAGRARGTAAVTGFSPP